MKKIAFLTFLALPLFVFSQDLIPEEDLDWTYRYSSYELEDVDPDSVFGFYEYGSVYSPEDFDESSEQLTTALLNCHNLQILELHNIMAKDVLEHIDEFPLLQYLILDNVGIAELPDGIYDLEYLKKLELYQFTELSFNPGMFSSTEIHQLTLDDNNIIHIPGLLLDGIEMWELNSLHLKGDFQVIPEAVFNCLSLVNLSIINSDLQEVSDAISNLEMLETIDFSGNYNLTTLPDEIGDLYNLRELNLSETGFETLPEGLRYCSSIETLNVSYSSLYEIPDWISDLSSLYNLNASNSALTDLPAELAGCENLYYLYLYYNAFTQIPSVIGKMTNLSNLDLSYNSITEVPAFLSGATSLSNLDLSGNPITAFQHNSLNLPNLYRLNLSGCGMGTLTPEIANCKALEYLYLDNDSLKSLPVELYQLKNLQTLNLESNSLKTIPDGIGALENLSELYVRNNGMTALPKDLGKCKSLYYLQMSDNKIKKFPKGLSGMEMLSSVDASGNKGIKFSKEFAKMPSLYSISLNSSDLTPKALAKLKKLVGEDKVAVYEW